MKKPKESLPLTEEESQAHAEEVTPIEPATSHDESDPAAARTQEIEDSEVPASTADADQQSHRHRASNFLGRHKVWASIAGVIVVLAMVAAIPWTRYKIAGLFLRQTITVTLVDSQSHTPVTSAKVVLGNAKVMSDNRGVAKLHVAVGPAKVVVTKAYYQTETLHVIVPIFKPKQVIHANFVSTGRPVSIEVTNKITGKPLESAVVKADGSEAQTDAKGHAIIVLSPNKTSVSANITAANYNAANATIQITASAVAANNFALTPSGKLYFLSNLSGKIDVVKTNLDGSGRETVLAGTGNEDPQNTSLLVSRDWKYLALYAARTPKSTNQLNLIDTTNNDKLTNIDEGANIDFTPVGWDGDYFVYTVLRSDLPIWQPQREAIKSFNAATGKITVLDQTEAAGSADYNYLRDTYANTYILNGSVAYGTVWDSSQYANPTAGHNPATLTSVQPDGSQKKVIQSFASPDPSVTFETLQTIPYEANGLYINAPDGKFYTYEDGTVKPNTTLTDQTFYTTPYATYLLSPSGNQTFWQTPADGKNNLLVGDTDGANGKQIAALSDYSVYGWFTDNYLLVSKNASELYIMPASGGTPLKVSDYYKPARTFNGYGSGYGGL